jgi:hypothetical protein
VGHQLASPKVKKVLGGAFNVQGAVLKALNRIDEAGESDRRGFSYATDRSGGTYAGLNLCNFHPELRPDARKLVETAQRLNDFGLDEESWFHLLNYLTIGQVLVGDKKAATAFGHTYVDGKRTKTVDVEKMAKSAATFAKHAPQSKLRKLFPR